MIDEKRMEEDMLAAEFAFLQMGGFQWTPEDYQVLKEACLDLREMMTQKTAGQRKNTKDIDWANLPRVKNTIILSAMTLVLSGQLETEGCSDHVVGHIDTGFNARNLTGSELLEEVQRDPAMVRKHFRRYRCCPECGERIAWDDEEWQ